MKTLAPLILGLVVLSACAANKRPPEGDRPSGAELGSWGVDTSSISKTVRPGDDFYRYVNEGWTQRSTIPAGFPNLTSFTTAYLRTEQQLADLLAEVRDTPQPPGSPGQRLSALYRSYVDVARLDRLGLSPIRPEIHAIQEAATLADVARIMARPFEASIVELGVDSDPSNPLRYTVIVEQGGLGLPTPDYYLRSDEPFAGHRRAYRDYIEDVFRRAGIDEARRRADGVLKLETAIASLHWSPAETRDRVRMNHPMRTADLPRFAPGFEWAAFLEESGVAGQAGLVVNTDTALQGLAALFARTPVAAWRSYLLFHCIDSRADLLSEEWQQAHFDFFGRRLSGIGQRRPLEQRAVETVNEVLGEDLGRLYVERHFPVAYRAQLDRMIGYMRTAYRERLQGLPWMDEPTRREALAKLDRVTSRIGYPDRWHDFSGVRMDPADLVGNVRRRVEWSRADDLARLGEARRDWEWPLDPQEINAGYVPSDNSINFPAAILQPPFFDPHADPAVNFGSIAAVIGHEIGHAFDDQGSRSDGDGRLRDWWTPASHERFRKRTEVLVSQYGKFSPVEGMHVNGSLTLGENIGDLGGLSIALEAYHRFVAGQESGKAPVLDGFSGDQRFFLAWAQVWRILSTPEDLRARLLADPHSPGEYRTNGVVRNVDAWYAAFSVQEGDALYLRPEDRVAIW